MAVTLTPSDLHADRFANGLLIIEGEDDDPHGAASRALDLMVETARPVALLRSGSQEWSFTVARELLALTAGKQLVIGSDYFVIGVGVEVRVAPGDTIEDGRFFLRLVLPRLDGGSLRAARRCATRESEWGLIVVAEDAGRRSDRAVWRRRFERARPGRGRIVLPE